MRPQTVRPAIDFILLKPHGLAHQHNIAPLPTANETDVMVGIVRPIPEKVPEIWISTHGPFLTNVSSFNRKSVGNLGYVPDGALVLFRQDGEPFGNPIVAQEFTV